MGNNWFGGEVGEDVNNFQSIRSIVSRNEKIIPIHDFMESVPDEIIIEVLRFLHPIYLLKSVQFCCERIHLLIESEFMYEHHHLKYLLDYVVKERESNQSWKEHMIVNIELQRGGKLIITNPEYQSKENRSIRIPKEKNSKIAYIEASNWSHGDCVFVDRLCNPGGHHEWEVELITNLPSPCNYWFILNESIEPVKGYEKIEYLFQLDGHGFFYNEGGFNKTVVKGTGHGSPPKTYFGGHKDVVLKITLFDWKWQFEVIHEEIESVVYCDMKKKDNVKGYYFGVANITLNQIKELRLISYRRLK